MLQDLLNCTKAKSIILNIFNCFRALTMQRLKMCNFLQQYSIKFSNLINNNTKNIYKKLKTQRVLQFNNIKYNVFVDFLRDSKFFSILY